MQQSLTWDKARTKGKCFTTLLISLPQGYHKVTTRLPQSYHKARRRGKCCTSLLIGEGCWLDLIQGKGRAAARTRQ